MENKSFDIIVIGGGIAGITAAIYARRAGKRVALIESKNFGGQISASPNIENFPGFISISGAEFSDQLLNQAKILNTRLILENVAEIIDGEIKSVRTEKAEYFAKAVIIATGLKHRKMELEFEDSFIGKGISYCAVCDGAFFKNRSVAVYGGGNTAIGDALFLSNICKKVTVIHRRNELRADTHIVNLLKEKKNVEFLFEKIVSALKGENILNEIELTDTSSGEKTFLEIDGLFVAIGNIPQGEIFGHITSLDEEGYIIADESCKTDTQGVFAAGDCRTKDIRQLATAAGDGSIAATEACRYIDNNAK